MSSDLNSDVTFRNLVQRMRTAQITYFKNRDGDSLYKSRQLEKEVDKMLADGWEAAIAIRSIGGKRAIMRVNQIQKGWNSLGFAIHRMPMWIHQAEHEKPLLSVLSETSPQVCGTTCTNDLAMDTRKLIKLRSIT